MDPSGLVHGLDGLRVVDFLIIPLITGGNLNAPTMMVAEKIVSGMTGEQNRTVAG